MTGKKIGYIRVSTKAQNPERQLADLNLDIVFTEHASGTSKTRPKLEEMLNYIRDEDIVYIHCMDRLARNLDDLRRIITVITDKKAQIKFVKEGLEFTGSKSPMSELMLSLMGAFAEFEHGLIKERQLEGIAKAKERGVYKRKLTDKKIKELQNVVAQDTELKKINKRQLAKQLGIGRATLYQYLRLPLSASEEKLEISQVKA